MDRRFHLYFFSSPEVRGVRLNAPILQSCGWSFGQPASIFLNCPQSHLIRGRTEIEPQRVWLQNLFSAVIFWLLLCYLELWSLEKKKRERSFLSPFWICILCLSILHFSGTLESLNEIPSFYGLRQQRILITLCDSQSYNKASARETRTPNSPPVLIYRK